MLCYTTNEPPMLTIMLKFWGSRLQVPIPQTLNPPPLFSLQMDLVFVSKETLNPEPSFWE